jgi:transcriptional regulator with XRE-family HTH domain
MTDQQVGAVFRAIRRRRGWRQEDLAGQARVDAAYVSLVERGYLGRLPLRALRRISAALEIDLPFAPRWRGPELAKLLDAEHAGLVERRAATLVKDGWEVLAEYTFNHFGERGSVDLVGWHAERQALCLNEIKTRIVDQQDLLSSNGRKRRIVPALLAAERGWEPRCVANLLVVRESSPNRRVIAAHPATFGAAFPSGAWAARSWLAAPEGDLAAILFLPDLDLVHAQQKRGGPTRVRVPREGRVAPGTSVDGRSGAGIREVPAARSWRA